MDLTVNTRTSGSTIVVTVAGELDVASAPGLRDLLLGSLNRCSELVLDLTAVTFLDSTGLQALLAARRRAMLNGERLRLRITANGPVQRILELTGLRPAFDYEQVVDLPRPSGAYEFDGQGSVVSGS